MGRNFNLNQVKNSYLKQKILSNFLQFYPIKKIKIHQNSKQQSKTFNYFLYRKKEKKPLKNLMTVEK